MAGTAPPGDQLHCSPTELRETARQSPRSGPSLFSWRSPRLWTGRLSNRPIESLPRGRHCPPRERLWASSLSARPCHPASHSWASVLLQAGWGLRRRTHSRGQAIISVDRSHWTRTPSPSSAWTTPASPCEGQNTTSLAGPTYSTASSGTSAGNSDRLTAAASRRGSGASRQSWPATSATEEGRWVVVVSPCFATSARRSVHGIDRRDRLRLPRYPRSCRTDD